LEKANIWGRTAIAAKRLSPAGAPIRCTSKVASRPERFAPWLKEKPS
jgi:hypothetical protein